MRRPAAFVACVAAWVITSAWSPAAAAAPAQSQKALCKQIRQAIAAGHTLDQIIQEFHTDVQQVTKCTQKRGRRRAPKAKKRQGSRSTAKPGARGSSTAEKPSDTPAQRAPRPRLGPMP